MGGVADERDTWPIGRGAGASADSETVRSSTVAWRWGGWWGALGELALSYYLSKSASQAMATAFPVRAQVCMQRGGPCLDQWREITFGGGACSFSSPVATRADLQPPASMAVDNGRKMECAAKKTAGIGCRHEETAGTQRLSVCFNRGQCPMHNVCTHGYTPRAKTESERGPVSRMVTRKILNILRSTSALGHCIDHTHALLMGVLCHPLPPPPRYPTVAVM